MRKGRRWFSLLLSLSMCFTASMSDQALVKAERVKTAVVDTDGLLQAGGLLKPSAQSGMAPYSPRVAAQMAEAEQALKDGWDKLEPSIDVSAYGITLDTVSNFVYGLMNENPQYFFVDGGFSYSYLGDNVSKLSFTYSANAQEERTKYEAKVKEILLKVDDSWTDIEKVLFVNDYIAVHNAYDTSLKAEHTHDAYGTLVNQSSVCQGYAEAFKDLMNRLDIPCEIVSSNQLNHAWDMVQIGESWYHVDVTWNDPTPNQIGKAGHSYLLKSTDSFQSETGNGSTHRADDYVFSGSVTGESAASKTYDDYFWNDIDSPFVYDSDSWYGIHKGTGALNQYSVVDLNFTSSDTPLLMISDKWPVLGGSGNWVGCFSTLASYDGSIYYSTPEKVIAYDLKSKESETVVTLTDEEKAENRIYGMTIEGNLLTYSLKASPNEKLHTEKTTTLHLHTYELDKDASVAATCTEDGKNVFKCSSCGRTKTEVVKALGHDCEIIIKKEATCTEDGEKAEKCKNCDYEKANVVIKALGHKEGEAATCTKPQVCIVCKEVISPALGHQMKAVAKKEATCAEDGNIAYWICETCKNCFSDAEGKNEIEASAVVIKALGHQMKAVAKKEATCTEDGNIAYWICETCKGYFGDAEGKEQIESSDVVIKALGHQMKAVAKKEATCAEDGNNAYWICETCKSCFSDAEGKKEIEVSDVIIKALGHQMKAVAKKEATCTEDGNNAYWICETCKGYFGDAEGKEQIESSDVVIKALGHTGGTATCTDKAVCERCGQPYGECDSSNHTGGTEIKGKIEATETIKGYTGDTCCKGCGTVLTKGEEIPVKESENPGGVTSGSGITGGEGTGTTGGNTGTTGGNTGTTGGNTGTTGGNTGTTGGNTGTTGGNTGTTGGNTGTTGGNTGTTGGNTGTTEGNTGTTEGNTGTGTTEENDSNKTETITKPDGSVVQTTTETKEDGTTVKTEVVTSADHKVTTTTTTQNIDGSSIEVTTSNSSNNETVVTVKKDSEGTVTGADASISQETDNSGKLVLNADTALQIVEAVGQESVEVTITVKDSAQNPVCEVKANTKDMVAGDGLCIYQIDSKTGNYVMVNAKTYVLKKGNDISLPVKEGNQYELVSKETAKTINKAILKTVKMKKTSATVKKGKKVSVKWNNKLNMDNVKKIQYTTSKKSIAVVSKKGKITAKKRGSVKIKAKVTLKNGDIKIITMKVKVKK